MSWIQTYLGKRYWPLNPSPKDVHIEDIAHSLAYQCRFNGHTKKHFSVAQHSVQVSYLVLPHLALQGLMHDAAEAYLTDMPRPIKSSEFKKIEEKNLQAIFERYGIAYPLHPDVKEADLVMLATEARDVMGGQVHDWGLTQTPLKEKIVPMSAAAAEIEFLTRFRELRNA